MAENSGQKRQFWVKSRSLPAEYDDMTGLGLLPAGLFSFLEESCFACDGEQGSEMHPLWTITLKRPGLRGIVQSNKMLVATLYFWRNM